MAHRLLVITLSRTPERLRAFTKTTKMLSRLEC